MLRDLPVHAPIVKRIHEVNLRLRIDGYFPLRPDDLGGILLPRSHHAGCVEVGELAVVEFDQSDGVVAVVVLAQVWFDGCDSYRGDAFHFAVLPEEPEGQVDVVDGAVDEDPAGELGVGDEEAARVQLVAGLAAHYGGCAQCAGGHFSMCVAVGGIEAAREAAHYFEVWFFGRCVKDGLGLYTAIPSSVKPSIISSYHFLPEGGHTTSTLVDNGFSQRTCFSALIALIACSA